MNRLIPTALLVLLITSCNLKSQEVSSDALNTDGYLYTYKNEPYTGKVIDTTKAGRVLLSFNCTDGKIEGDYVTYHENGYPLFQVKYINGVKEGLGNRYFTNGKTLKTETYLSNQLTGPYKEYYVNGKTKFSGEYLNWERTGNWEEFTDEGLKKSIGKYLNGLQNGYWEYYYPSGSIHACGNYINGNETDLGRTGIPLNGRNGIWKFYNKEGNYLEVESNFKDGEQNGLYKEYFPNGAIRFLANYENGRLNGTLEEYNDTGKLINKYSRGN